jgi:aspartate ammonia-lyase
VGYETAARIAREAIVSGTPVRELILRDNLLTREQLDSILDPFEMTSPGIAGAKEPKQEHVWKNQDQDEKS